MTQATIITPQRLGAIIKKTGVRKAVYRKGRMYPFWTEGYHLDRHHTDVYTLSYDKETTLSRMSDWAHERFRETQAGALSTICSALSAHGIKWEIDGSNTVWITIPQE